LGAACVGITIYGAGENNGWWDSDESNINSDGATINPEQGAPNDDNNNNDDNNKNGKKGGDDTVQKGGHKIKQQTAMIIMTEITLQENTGELLRK